MQMKQVGSLRRSAQAGFTLIELIVVIVILGILAATALPKFADLGADARYSKIKGARAAVSSAVSLVHGRWLASGSPSTPLTVSLDGTTVTINSTGFPTADAAGIGTAAGISSPDFNIDTSSGYSVSTDSSHTSCAFTYSATGGTVGAVPTSSSSC